LLKSQKMLTADHEHGAGRSRRRSSATSSASGGSADGPGGLDAMLTFGAFQVRFCLIFWLANLFAESAWYSAVSFVVLEVSGEWGLPASQAGLYPVCLFTGQFFGSFFFGMLADRIGRRPVLILCMSGVSVSGLCCAFAPAAATAFLGRHCGYAATPAPSIADGCFVPLMTALFVQGVFLGGTIPTYTALLTEFLPVERRGATVNMLMSSWTIGYAVVPFLGLFMLTPEGAGYNWMLFGQSGWRLIYILLCFCSSLATLALALTVPESLRFMLLRGRRAEARLLLARMVRGGAVSMPQALAEERLGLDDWAAEAVVDAGWEGRQKPIGAATLQASGLEASGLGEANKPLLHGLLEPVMKHQGEEGDDDAAYEAQSFCEQLSALVYAPGMRRTTLCLWCIWFPISFAGNGFAVFLPMMQRLRHVSARLVMMDNVLWAGAGTVGILFGSTLLETKAFGRKRTLAIGLFGCASTYLAFALAKDNTVLVVVSCINNLANNIGWGALFTYTAEVHPTELRALGCGCANMIKSLAGIFGPYFAGIFAGGDLTEIDAAGGSSTGSAAAAELTDDRGGVLTALAVFCALDLCACVAALLLPMETRGVVLAESVHDSESAASTQQRRRTDGSSPPLSSSKR
jgi:MFS family permease